MGNTAAALSQYQQALKAGRRAHRQSVHSGSYPYLHVLDEMLTEGMTAGEVYLGLLDIPIEKIVGTKTRGRTNAFASNFMPLLPEGSEFGQKWRKLCEAHLSDEGITDPIECYEYLGRFYVAEGNKRVSVMKSFGAATISAVVTRILPAESTAIEVVLYKEFLQYYPMTGLYRINFSRLGSFPKLQIALGYEPDHVWSLAERRRFTSGFYYFVNAFKKLGGEELGITAADALLVWLEIYPFEKLREMSAAELGRSLQAVWADVRSLERGDAIEMSTDAIETGDKGIFNKIVSSLLPGHLKIAFIHELEPERSNWVRNHELGRARLEEALGSHISTMCFAGVGRGEVAESAMEEAVQKGADVIFATTAPLIGACRRVAARHPNVKILNCSVSMPYTGVRTYYSRIYEGKFISGAIAGALSDNNNIGYIASYPIFGVPAGINAFALGAQLTNPRARVQLKWSCVPGDPLAELKELGVDFVSTLDIPMPGWEAGLWGCFQLMSDGSTRLIASPYWDWGEFYIKIVRGILSGDWEGTAAGKGEGRAVNYWWGMASGVIGIEYAKAMPEGLKTLIEYLRKGIVERSIVPFDRRIVSRDGVLRSDGSHHFSPEEILHMDWLCENVDGIIPSYDSLREQSKAIVRLQGIYRDSIPPEKEVPIK